MLHSALHGVILTALIAALVAAFQSHNLKLPEPIPNLYSPHSLLGISVFFLFCMQVRSLELELCALERD